MTSESEPSSNRSHSLSNGLTTILVVLFGLASVAFSQSSAQPCVPVGPRPPLPDAVQAVKAATMTMQISPEVAATLRAARIFQAYWLSDTKSSLQGVATVRHGTEDVLLARWRVAPGQPHIKSISMWDGATYELVIFEIDQAVMASRKSIREFLRTLLKPPGKLRMSGPTLTPEQLKDGFGFRVQTGSGSERVSGWILRMPMAQRRGFDEEVFAIHAMGGRLFLIFDFGKHGDWPVGKPRSGWPQSIHLGYRFPPFANLVQGWSRDRLLQELAQPPQEGEASCWGREARDRVLVGELIRRGGLNEDEFQQVIDGVDGRSVMVSELRNAGEVARYTNFLVKAIDRYEWLQDINMIPPGKTEVGSHLAELIRALLPLPSGRGDPDLSDSMLDLIARNHEAEEALLYIKLRVWSSENISSDLGDRLAAAKVPPGLEEKRDLIVQSTRVRISRDRRSR